MSLWWAHLNRNKRCVSLNLWLPDRQELLKRLVAGADVLIESFRPGTMESWGLGFDELREVDPALVMVRTGGFGQTGPYSSRPGFGTIAEAMTGFASMHRSTDGTPVLPRLRHGRRCERPSARGDRRACRAADAGDTTAGGSAR